MAGWSDFIQTGSYDAIEFDFVSTNDRIERVVDRQEMPNRDGRFIEDRAREGLVFDVLAIFVEDDYPGKMTQLRDSILAGGIKEFVHPIFGKFKAIVTTADIAHNADDSIDSATMQLHVEEHTEGAAGIVASRTSVAAKASSLRDAVLTALNALTLFAAAVDALEAAGTTLSSVQRAIVDQAIADGDAATVLAGDASNTIEANASDMSADEVQAQANGVLTLCNAVVVAISSFTTAATPLPEQYDYSQAMIALASSTTDLASTAAIGRPVLTTYIVEADLSLFDWVFAKYKDTTRVGEVLALNPWIADPLLLPRGSEVTAYAS